MSTPLSNYTHCAFLCVVRGEGGGHCIRRILLFGELKERKVAPSHKSDLFPNKASLYAYLRLHFLGSQYVTKIGRSEPEAAVVSKVQAMGYMGYLLG
jgi:hypothetical protein